MLQADLSSRARIGQSPCLTYSHPRPVGNRLNGGNAPAPTFRTTNRRGGMFRPNWVARRSTRRIRRPGARSSSRSRRLNVALRRRSGACRIPVSKRCGAAKTRAVTKKSSPWRSRPISFQFMSLGVSWAGLGELLRAYENDVPVSVVRAIGAPQDLVGGRVALRPLGVIEGMVSAMVTRASYSARLSWFQSLA